MEVEKKSAITERLALEAEIQRLQRELDRLKLLIPPTLRHLINKPLSNTNSNNDLSNGGGVENNDTLTALSVYNALNGINGSNNDNQGNVSISQGAYWYEIPISDIVAYFFSNNTGSKLNASAPILV